MFVTVFILYLLKAAYYSVMTLRTMFDVFSGYTWGKWFNTLDEKKWLTRIIYLETVAGVPGIVSILSLSHVVDVVV